MARMQGQAPQSEVGEVLASALEIYLDCLVQVEELVAEGAEIDESRLAPLYHQASTANQIMDELSQPQEAAGPGWFV